jgi:hypothetical protein
MWSQPEIDQELISMAKTLDCSWIGEVLVDPDLNYDYNNCHNNVLTHVNEHGGTRVIGFSRLRHVASNKTQCVA